MSKDINKYTCTARLTHDCKVTPTQSGRTVVSFGIAVADSRKQGETWVEYPHFFDVKMWGPHAEAFAGFHQKGSRCALAGKLCFESFERKDGSRGSKVFIEASEWSFVGSNPQEGNAGKYRDKKAGERMEATAGPAPRKPEDGDIGEALLGVDESPF